jgi:purine-binding chemotaxis protein CheW
MSTSKVLSFRFNEQLFALDVNAVLDIVPVPHLTPIPQAPVNLLGLTDFGGSLVCVFDPRPGLDMPTQGADGPKMTIVVQTQEGPIGLLIGEVGQVLELEKSALERPPSTMSKKARTLIRHICQREDELLFVLNPNQIALAS